MRKNGVFAQRFGQIVVQACGKDRDIIAFHCVGSDSHNRGAVQTLFRLYHADQAGGFLAVDFRHRDVHEDHVWLAFPKDINCLLAVSRKRQVDIKRLHQFAEHQSVGLIVFGGKHTHLPQRCRTRDRRNLVDLVDRVPDNRSSTFFKLGNCAEQIASSYGAWQHLGHNRSIYLWVAAGFE